MAFDLGWLPSTTFDTPIISIGNLTVGGTGKTPHTEYIISLLKEDFKVATLSRGYKRKTKGYVTAVQGDCNMERVGDEPSQIKNKFPDITVAVDEKRVNGISQLLKSGNKPEVILLDDAFQHRYVKPGLNILLTDYNRPIWKDNIMPFGRLREDADGKERADVIIVTKCPENIGKKEKAYCIDKLNNKNNAPVFFSTIYYGSPIYLFNNIGKKELAITADTEILLLTGIACPEPLKIELEKRGAKVTLMQFPDHHNFTERELKEVEKKFLSVTNKEKAIITTEKDAERMISNPNLPQIIKENIYVIPIKIKIIDNENKFNQIIIDYVRKNKRNSGIS